MKYKRGFTIVELLVVVVVIGILATIGIVSYSNHKKTSRDYDRSTKATLIADALEKYYQQNGEYPGCTAITAAATTVQSSTLKGIDTTTLLAPKAATGVTNSIACADLTTGTTSDIFSYTGDASAACVSGASCSQWVIKYKEEATGEIVTIKSMNPVQVATAGTPTLSVTVASFTQVNASWAAVAGAASYELQQATNNTFTANVVNTPTAGTSSSATGLTYGSTYYFRVRAIVSGVAGAWSTVKSVTTQSLATPVITASALSNSSVQTSWATVTNAATYTVECSLDGTTWTGCTMSVSIPTATFTNVSQGRTHYLRAKAVNGTFSSGWSNVASTSTGIDNPVAYNTSSSYSVASGWNMLWSTSDAVCPAGTTPSYDWYYGSSKVGWQFWESGTAYKTVGYTMSWDETVTTHVASRCITSETSSSFVWSDNYPSRTISWPTSGVKIGLLVGEPTWRGIQWWGTCPEFSTSMLFEWQVNAAWGNQYSTSSTNYGIWTKTGSVWGDGGGINRTHCYGPWGDAYADARASFGTGCIPTKLYAICYAPTW